MRRPTRELPRPAHFILVATSDSATRIDVARRVARLGMTTLATLDDTMAVAAARTYDHDLLGVILDGDLSPLGARDVAQELEQAIHDLPLLVLNRSERGELDSSAPSISPADASRVSTFLQQIADSVPPQDEGPAPGSV